MCGSEDYKLISGIHARLLAIEENNVNGIRPIESQLDYGGVELLTPVTFLQAEWVSDHHPTSTGIGFIEGG